MSTILDRKPSARSIPIDCRLSSTALNERTPMAATPTIRPMPMNPWKSWLKASSWDRLSCSSRSVETATMLRSMNAVSMRAATSSAVTFFSPLPLLRT